MSFLNRLSIKTKLYLIVGLSAASLALAIGLAADSMRARLVEERVAKLRSIDEVAVGLAASLEQRAAAGEISHAEAIDRFRKDLHEMRYDGQAGLSRRVRHDRQDAGPYCRPGAGRHQPAGQQRCERPPDRRLDDRPTGPLGPIFAVAPRQAV